MTYEVYFPNPPTVYFDTDAVLGIYYNVLYPEEDQIEEQNLISQWLRGKSDLFPFTDKKFTRSAPFFLGRTPVSVFEGIYAEHVLKLLQEGEVLEEALESSLSYMQEYIIPIYFRKATVIFEKMEQESRPLIKERYKILYESLINCCRASEATLFNSKNNFLSYPEKKELYALLEGYIQKRKKLELPESNRWDHRIVSLKETVENVIKLAPNAPYFLALQEVTSQSLEDLKKSFPSLNWISYNTTTGKKTQYREHEEQLGEFLSFTVTLALSSKLQVVRIEHEELPSVSGSLRRILGVEVIHKELNRHFAIFTVHTDYLVKDQLYERNVESITAFVEKFADRRLPFIFGGDLNAFENIGGDAYIKSLQHSGPFAGSVDYRQGPFFAFPSVADSTFLGHILDSFKMPLEEKEGLPIVQPNALDHIFLKDLKVIFGTRDAGVYDEKGHYVDPYTDVETYKKRLLQRKTASDHFLNAVLFKFD
jgi:endonuclease/exonuclease/phosphatase family metal-dependent hydrolase